MTKRDFQSKYLKLNVNNFFQEKLQINSNIFFVTWIFVILFLSSLFEIPAVYAADGKILHSSNVSIIKDSLLSDGVSYQLLEVRNGRLRHRVHAIIADTKNPSCSIDLMLGQNRAGGLAKIHELAYNYDSLRLWEVVGAINGSFWRAYNNFPIGPTFIGGEAVEVYTHKNWSSAFFDEDNRVIIDTFRISTTVDLPRGARIFIDRVNRRRDSTGCVLYNKFAGDTIPFVMTDKLMQTLDDAQMEALQDSTFSDVTEDSFDIEKYKAEMINSERISNTEFHMKKAILEYIDETAINTPIRCVVKDTASGAVEVPQNGCILSFGLGNSLYQELVCPGDTLILKYSTNVHRQAIFLNSLSATPRLVRNGTARHEAAMEGSRSRRFINTKLPRSALGTDKTGTFLILAVAEGSSRQKGATGASLADMSLIMKSIGCHNAMNLDGGGSSVMLIDNVNVTKENLPMSSRRIAIGIAIIRPKSGLLKNLFFED